MNDRQSQVLADKQEQPSRGTARQGAMKNTRADRSGGPKPSVKPLDTQTRGTRDK